MVLDKLFKRDEEVFGHSVRAEQMYRDMKGQNLGDSLFHKTGVNSIDAALNYLGDDEEVLLCCLGSLYTDEFGDYKTGNIYAFLFTKNRLLYAARDVWTGRDKVSSVSYRKIENITLDNHVIGGEVVIHTLTKPIIISSAAIVTTNIFKKIMQLGII